MNQNIFVTFMEAAEDLLQGFDPDAMDDGAEIPTPSNSNTEQPMGDLLSPPMSEDQLSMNDMDDMGVDGDGENGTDDAETKEDSISKKVSNNLNSDLLTKFTEKNEFIEKTVVNLRQLIPLLPSEVVQKVNDNIKTLNNAFEKGKDYTITKFVDKEYGENLMYYEKLNVLYELLLKNINNDIKTILK